MSLESSIYVDSKKELCGLSAERINLRDVYLEKQRNFLNLANEIPSEYVSQDGALEYLYASELLEELLSYVDFTAIEKCKYDYEGNVKSGCLLWRDSASCLLDVVRTNQFMGAIDERIEQLRQQRGDKTIYAVDAGCGAIPILAIRAALADENVKVTALELNPVSVDIAKQIIGALGLTAQINVIEADAITYNPLEKGMSEDAITSKKPFDLVMSETLDSALLNEQVAPIMNNLRHFLADDGYMIPESAVVILGSMPVPQASHKILFHGYCDRSVYVQKPYYTYPITNDNFVSTLYNFKEEIRDIHLQKVVGKNENFTFFATHSLALSPSHSLKLHESLITKVCPFGFREYEEYKAGNTISIRYSPGSRKLEGEVTK